MKKQDPGESSWNMNSLLSAPMRRWSSSAWRFIFFSHRAISFLSGNAMPYTRCQPNTQHAHCQDNLFAPKNTRWAHMHTSACRQAGTASATCGGDQLELGLSTRLYVLGILCPRTSDSSYHKRYLPLQPHTSTHARTRDKRQQSRGEIPEESRCQRRPSNMPQNVGTLSWS